MRGRDIRRLCLTIASSVLGLAFPMIAAAQTWVEDSYADFADGRLDASGQNIYVSRDGSVRTIHRFDLNQDSFIDLVFNVARRAPRAVCTRPNASPSSIPSTLAVR